MPLGSLPDSAPQEYTALTWYSDSPSDDLYQVLIEVEKAVSNAIQEIQEA